VEARTRLAVERLIAKTRSGELQWLSGKRNFYWQEPLDVWYRTVYPKGDSEKKWALYVGTGMRYMRAEGKYAKCAEFWIALLTDGGEVSCRLASDSDVLRDHVKEAEKSLEKWFSTFLTDLLAEDE